MRIVVPVMPTTLEEVNDLDPTLYQGADIIEWRADYLPYELILSAAPALFEKFSGYEILFTLRTHKEGGHLSVTPENYIKLLLSIENLYQPDYLDVEYFSYQEVFDQLLECSNLVLSYTNEKETPENLLEIFSELTALSPKVVKIAVTPHNPQDVLDVMNYTRGFKTLNPEQLYVSMSMERLGRLSRLAGELTGSAWTFVSLSKERTCPGQLTLAELLQIQSILDTDD